MKTGVELISEERQRQINKGYDANHDSQHDFRKLMSASITYINAAFLTTKSEEIGYSDVASIGWHKYNEPLNGNILNLRGLGKKNHLSQQHL